MRLDLNTVVIPRERKIWVVHPGKNKKFFADFQERNRIFLEYPDLSVTQKLLDDDTELRRRIRYSLELMRYDGLTRSDGTTISVSDLDGDSSNNVAVYLRTVKHLFQNMDEGDLVIVPGWGAYARVLFGEVVGPVNFNQKDRIYPHAYADIQYRNVKWLSTDRTKAELGDLVKYVNKPPAIAEVGRNPATDEFFDFAYDSYVMEDKSWSTITAPKYRSNDPSAISDSVKIVEFAVASFWAMERGQSLSGLTFDEIIEKYYSTEGIEHFGLSYASPGRLDFKARNTRLSIYVAAVVALASVGGISGCKATGQPIDVENSETPSPKLNADLKGQISVLVNQVDAPTARQLEKKGAHAVTATGINTPIAVRP